MEALDKLRARLILIVIAGAGIAGAWLYYRYSIVIPGDYFSFSKAGVALSQATMPLLIVMIGNMFSNDRPESSITSGQKVIVYVITGIYSLALVLGGVFDTHYLELTMLPWVLTSQALIAAPIAYIFGKAQSIQNENNSKPAEE